MISPVLRLFWKWIVVSTRGIQGSGPSSIGASFPLTENDIPVGTRRRTQAVTVFPSGESAIWEAQNRSLTSTVRTTRPLRCFPHRERSRSPLARPICVCCWSRVVGSDSKDGSDQVPSVRGGDQLVDRPSRGDRGLDRASRVRIEAMDRPLGSVRHATIRRPDPETLAVGCERGLAWLFSHIDWRADGLPGVGSHAEDFGLPAPQCDQRPVGTEVHL